MMEAEDKNPHIGRAPKGTPFPPPQKQNVADDLTITSTTRRIEGAARFRQSRGWRRPRIEPRSPGWEVGSRALSRSRRLGPPRAIDRGGHTSAASTLLIAGGPNPSPSPIEDELLRGGSTNVAFLALALVRVSTSTRCSSSCPSLQDRRFRHRHRGAAAAAAAAWWLRFPAARSSGPGPGRRRERERKRRVATSHAAADQIDARFPGVRGTAGTRRGPRAAGAGTGCTTACAQGQGQDAAGAGGGAAAAVSWMSTSRSSSWCFQAPAEGKTSFPRGGEPATAGAEAQFRGECYR
ncbi:hypothetical protein F4809DRAFT_627157 [Biscogniauxia mediterranea]|nr:hypothetical protein F4809DRAFT_627157 [Biscogniauxia mediterranea]